MRKKKRNRVEPIHVMFAMLAVIVALVIYSIRQGMERTLEKENQVRRLNEYMIRFTGMRTIE